MKKQIKVIYANMVVLLLELLVLPLIGISAMLCRVKDIVFPKDWGLTNKDMWKITYKLNRIIVGIIHS